MKKTKVLIVGGTGLVGRYLSKMLSDKNYEVAHLSSGEWSQTLYPTYYCNYTNSKIDELAVSSADVIIQLAGANIAEKKWTKKRKQIILDSRVKTTELIFSAIKYPIKKRTNNLKVFISASAVGYYGAVTTDKVFVEEDQAHNDFLGDVCQKWEQAADLFNEIGVRTVKIRTGVVLSQSKGALEKIKKSFKFGTKVILGSGKQFMPWIHIHDLCNIYIKAIEDNTMSGAYNAVAPQYTSYSQFADGLKSVYKNIFLSVKVPAFFLRTILGEMSLILLEGSRISVNKILSTGFKYKYPKLQEALEELIIKNKK